MTPRVLAVTLFVLSQIPGNPQQPPLLQPRKASIAGTVTSAASGDPLIRAQIAITRIVPPTPATGVVVITSSTASAQIPPYITERDGKFEFKDLEPGQYRIRVIRNGYALQEFGQRTPTGAGTPVSLADGQQLKDINFKLVPAGVVTGRVRDSNGEPIGRVQVSLLRSIYNINGQRNLSSTAAATTDDRGEYRIFWVPAGRYLVSVSSTNSGLPLEFLIASGGPLVDRTFPPTYYPGTVEASRALSIDLQPGAEISGIDFVISPPKMYRIRGKLVDSATGQAPRSANVSITPRQEPNTNVVLTTNTGASTAYNNTDGMFEVRNVLPGAYWLRAQAGVNSADPVDRNLVAQARTNSDLIDLALIGNRGSMTQTSVDVGGQDIEGLALTLAPGITIPIQLSVEGQELSAINGYDRIRVQLRPTSPQPSAAVQRIGFTPEGLANLDGVFPGEYRINVSLPAPDYFVKEARFERQDVLNDPWQISNRTPGTLSIVLSPKSGLIEGNLVNALSQPVAGNQVVLIPDQGRDRPELFKSAQTDANGHFTIRGVYPGGYKLYSWEALEANSYYDRDVLSQYEAQGKPVRIQEGSKETVDLKLILPRQ